MLIRLIVLLTFLGLGACETAQQVAACVKWCESPPVKDAAHHCEFDQTTFYQGVRYCECKCYRSFAADRSPNWSD